MAEDLLALARHLNISEPLHIIGHSMGGRVALMARLIEPAAVSAITLLDISPRPTLGLAGDVQHLLERLLVAPAQTRSRDEMRQFFLDDGLSAPLTDWMLMNLVVEDGVYRWRIDRQGLGEMHRRDAKVDLWEAVETPGLTVRCIRGGLSPFVSEEDKARLERAGVSVDTLPNAGHFVHVDAQAALLERMRADS
jgi:esterase